MVHKIRLVISMILALLLWGVFFPAPVLAAAAAGEAVRTINFPLGEKRIYSKNVHGLNQNWFRDFRVDNNLVTDALRSLRFGAVRFHGGTVSMFFDWATGAPDADEINQLTGRMAFVKANYTQSVLTQILDSTQPYSMEPEYYTQIIQGTGSEALATVNTCTNTAEEVIQGLRKIKDKGLILKYLELGNEASEVEGKCGKYDQYKQKGKAISQAARNFFPGIKIAAWAWAKGDKDSSWFDALVQHRYYGIDNEGAEDPATWVFQIDRLDLPREISEVSMPGKEVWFTEWNFNGTGFDGSYLHAYFTLDHILQYLKYPNVTMANYHSLYHSSMRQWTILRVRKKYVNQYFYPRDQTKRVPTNTYSVDEFFVKNVQYWPLTWLGETFEKYSHTVMGQISGGTDYDIVAAYFFNPADTGGGSLLLVNRKSTPFKLNITGAPLGNRSVTYTYLALPWDSVPSETQEITPKVRSVTADQIVLPGYAIAYVKPLGSGPTSTPTPGVIPGDLDGNGKVNNADWLIMKTDFGKTGNAGWIKSDIIKNGKVDIYDYNVLVGNFGR